MKTLFIVANWKSNKTVADAKSWFSKLVESKPVIEENKKVIICPPFTLLSIAQQEIEKHDLQISLGAQNSSRFVSGPYTGEINAEQIKDFGNYTILGHSERRQHSGETPDVLKKKVFHTLEYDVTPIFCVQGVVTPIPDGVTVVAYEPIDAIGTGHPDSPEHADNVAMEIKQKHPGVQYVLYGGSITPDNVNSFTKLSHIDGVLVGGASLDPLKFAHLIENA
jgi:triosephosphate isomerase